jgi:murein DD-endopeptidase MepM/ murein hydrolase activator NlpD
VARKLFAGVVAAAIAGLLAAAPAVARSAADVAALQVALRAAHVYAGGVDGVAGPATRAAVRRVQARRGLAVDAVAGPRTRRALGRRGRPRLGSRPLALRARGWDVAALQFLLARQGFPSGAVDGGLGPRSDAALRRPAPRSPLRFQRPVAAAVGDTFGPRGVGFHPGLDFVAQARDPVRAGRSGCVVRAGWYPGGYGKLIILSHGLGVTSWYAHLSRIRVRRGACVAAGARIGAVGSTGASTGPHLHFEVRLRGAAVDPAGSVR